MKFDSFDRSLLTSTLNTVVLSLFLLTLPEMLFQNYILLVLQ